MIFGPLFEAMVDSMSVRFKNARAEKMPLNIRIQWNAGTACGSECVLKTLACPGLRVGPSKFMGNSTRVISEEKFTAAMPQALQRRHWVECRLCSCVALRGFALRGLGDVRGFPFCGGKKGLRLPLAVEKGV